MLPRRAIRSRCWTRARLRKKAAVDGLDSNNWFGNVELEMAEDIGQETMTEVGNVGEFWTRHPADSRLLDVAGPLPRPRPTLQRFTYDMKQIIL
jgi:hypothetical protein